MRPAAPHEKVIYEAAPRPQPKAASSGEQAVTPAERKPPPSKVLASCAAGDAHLDVHSTKNTWSMLHPLTWMPSWPMFLWLPTRAPTHQAVALLAGRIRAHTRHRS